MIHGKKGGGEGILWPEIIFNILNIVILGALFLAVGRAGVAAVVYEESYAKQIALMMDSAKPGTSFMIDISELKKAAESRGAKVQITLSCETNSVFVKATSSGGFKQNFFSRFKNCEQKLNDETNIFEVKIK